MRKKKRKLRKFFVFKIEWSKINFEDDHRFFKYDRNNNKKEKKIGQKFCNIIDRKNNFVPRNSIYVFQ